METRAGDANNSDGEEQHGQERGITRNAEKWSFEENNTAANRYRIPHKIATENAAPAAAA